MFIQEVTPDVAETLGLDKAEGALVSSVNENSPADAGGIEPGDVVLSFDGKPILKMRDLPRVVAETEVGSNAEVELFRGGKPMTLTVTLGEREKAELVGLVGEEKPSDKKSFGSLGFSVENLNAELAGEYGLEADVTGVVVTEVIPGSPSAEKGLTPGDIIRRFGQRQVEGADELAKAIQAAEETGRSGVLILVEREGRERFVQIGFAEK